MQEAPEHVRHDHVELERGQVCQTLATRERGRNFHRLLGESLGEAPGAVRVDDAETEAEAFMVELRLLSTQMDA